MKVSLAAERDPVAVGIGDGGGTAVDVRMVGMANHVKYSGRKRENEEEVVRRVYIKADVQVFDPTFGKKMQGRGPSLWRMDGDGGGAR